MVELSDETVAEACVRRHNCRYGLQGVRMRHLPTGREFTCDGSLWRADDELWLRPEAQPSQPLPLAFREDHPPYAQLTDAELGLVHLGAIPPQPINPDSIVPASECILLARWPVVCCRPRPRRKGRREAKSC